MSKTYGPTDIEVLESIIETQKATIARLRAENEELRKEVERHLKIQHWCKEPPHPGTPCIGANVSPGISIEDYSPEVHGEPK